MTDQLTDKRLAEIQKLVDRAKDGPWSAYSEHTVLGPDQAILDPICGVAEPGNAAFIAAARTAVPELIAEVRRLRECEQAYPHTLATLRERDEALAKVAEWEDPDSKVRQALLEQIVFDVGEGVRSEVELREGQLDALERKLKKAEAEVERLTEIVGQFAFPNMKATPEMVADWIRRRGQLRTQRDQEARSDD